MIGVFLSLFMTGLSLVWKLVRFTGVWISFLLVLLIDDLILGNVFQLHINVTDYPTIYPVYEAGMIVLMLIPIVLVTGYHLYRLVKPKPVIPPSPPVMPETPAEIAARQESIRETKALAAELMRRRESDRLGQAAFTRMREAAAKAGYMREEEIEAEISATRQEETSGK